MKRFSFPSFLCLSLLLCGCSETPTLSTGETLVVQAFLYDGIPVEDVQIKRSVPLGSTDTLGIPVSDAIVRLRRGGETYALEPDPTAAGFYYDPEGAIDVEPGDVWNLEIEYEGETLTAETTVPSAPTITSQSDTVIVVESTFTPGSRNAGMTVHWTSGASGALFFSVIDNLEESPTALPTAGGFGGRFFRFVSAPSAVDSFRVTTFQLTHLGRHVLRVYQVNQEYAALYESRTQSTRDLNEPASNIMGGLGIFSAFASDTVHFEVETE